MKANETPKYLDERQVAKITGRGVQTLRNERSLGKGIPYIKLDRAVRYNYSDVIDFMERRKVQPGN